MDVGVATSPQPIQGVPTGTVTFLLTDVEQSTRLWEEAPETAGVTLNRHLELVAEGVTRHDGVRPQEQGEGDSAVAVFGSAVAAAAAALDIQRAMDQEPWPEAAVVRVRIGLHSGEGQARGERNYEGPAIHRCARLRDVAHGGQTLLSGVTAALVSGSLPAGAWLEELGTHRLRDLKQPERIFALRHADLPGDFPPVRSLDVVPNNLPPQLTSFLGREAEVATVRGLLAHNRLVCVTGSGGCGKTRLALQVAAAESDRFPDGVWWIDLASVSRPEQVAELAAAAIGLLVEPVSGPLHALAVQLRDRRLLLCFDNCEHLLDAVAEVAGAVQAACPDAAILATSRESLGLAWESVWRVPSLHPREAELLFAERAAHVRPGFVIDDGNRDAVTTICHRLDGIPLAIELAAAWVRALSSAEIADGLHNRFRLLAGGRRGVAARHQTLLASVQWSHDLLAPDERAVLRRLSVFAGGCTLDAAQDVCAGGEVHPEEVLDIVARLVDKSLVIAEELDGTRYRLLETVRQYAADRLVEAEETEAVRARHFEHFRRLAETAAPELMLADQDRWCGLLEVEHDNLRSALDWALSAPDPDPGRIMAFALMRFWATRGHATEGLGIVERAIEARSDDRSVLQCWLLAASAFLASVAGRLDDSITRASEGLDLGTALGDDFCIASCQVLLALAELYIDLDASRQRAIIAEQHARAAGEDYLADVALDVNLLTLANQSRHAESLAIADAVLPRWNERGDRFSGSFASLARTLAALFTGDVRGARDIAARSLEETMPLNDFYAVGVARTWLAVAQGLAGEVADAHRTMEPLVRALDGAGSDQQAPMMAVTMGGLHLAAGELEEADPWLERAVRWGAAVPDNLLVAEALPPLADLRRRLGQAEEARHLLDRGLALGRRLGLVRVEAKVLDGLGRLSLPEDPKAAEARFHEALARRVEHGLRTFYVDSLDVLAVVATRAGSHVEAVRLLAASDAGREVIGYARPVVDEPERAALEAELRSALSDEAFTTAWQEGAALGLDDAVAYARRARGERQRPSFGWDSLTPTEHAVVDLVVEGLTNAGIGEKLFVSPATVKTHLSHVYAKLGLSSRAELAAAVASRRVSGN